MKDNQMSKKRSKKIILSFLLAIFSFLWIVSAFAEDVIPVVKFKDADIRIVLQSIAERAIKRGLKKVVFDRNGFLYHGRIKLLADAAREQGLEF